VYRYGDPFDTATCITVYPFRFDGNWANITVTPLRVSVWYFNPFDSNSITCPHNARLAIKLRTTSFISLSSYA
jgi:hypothetical protein